MNHYRHFDDEVNRNSRNSSAILPEIEIDEPFQLDISPQLHHYPSKFERLRFLFSRRTRLERYLCALITLLLVIFALLILISLFYHKQTSIHTLCLTPSCVQVSYTLTSGMNQSVDPCDDFYEFVCGKWIRTRVIPAGHSSWSTLQELSQRNKIILKSLLEPTSTTSLPKTAQETIKYYQSCMNQTELERLQSQPLENFFQTNLNFTIKQWINLDRTQTWPQLFVDLTKRLATKYGFSSLLQIDVDPDAKNSSWNNLNIDQPQLGLGSRDYYIDSPTDNRSNARNLLIRQAYAEVGSKILQLLGFERNDSIERMNNIIQFETELAAVSLPMEILQKPNETYSLITIKQLQEQYQAIGFDIYSFLNDMLNVNASNPIVLNDGDQILVLSLELMLKVSTIITSYLLTANKSSIVLDYLLFMFVSDVSSYLSSSFAQTKLPLSKVLFGTESMSDRWEYCVRQTDSAFGYALGALYVDAVFGETDRSKAESTINTVREVFEDNLNTLQWIDEQSKVEARRKLENMHVKIGYPDFIKNQTKLDERYAGYPMIVDGYFNNQMNVFSRGWRRVLLQYRQKVDRSKWDMTPSTVNAYYSPLANEIVFPAGILQPPFFQKNLPLSIIFGGIGTIFGHEITHGFDNQGREFDADGNLRSWWTSSSLNAFKEKSQCFIRQYSNFSQDGENENGQRTLGENIADNGGLKLSYLAYQKHKSTVPNNANNLRIPGLDYTSDQLFFIAFAHNWCDIDTSNDIHYELVNDPHSLDRFRVMGTIQNSDEFSKAFSCPSKTSMNPSEKCQLW